MMSVVAPTWADAVRGPVTARQTRRTSAPRRQSCGITLRSRSAAADRKARLSRGAGRDRDSQRVGARDSAVAGHAAQGHRVVAGGNPGRGNAVVRADRSRLAGVQSHRVAGRKVRPGGGRRDGETARRRGAADREGGSSRAAGRYGDGLRVGRGWGRPGGGGGRGVGGRGARAGGGGPGTRAGGGEPPASARGRARPGAGGGRAGSPSPPCRSTGAGTSRRPSPLARLSSRR